MKTLRELIDAHTLLESRVVKVETAIRTVETNTETIIDLVSNGKKYAGYAIRYGRPILTFVVGIALAAGWISTDVADAIRSVPL